MPLLHKNTPGLKSRFQPDLGPLQRLPYTLFGVYLPKAQGQGWGCTVTCSFPHIRLTNTIRWGIYRWGMTSTRYSFVLSRDERTIMPSKHGHQSESPREHPDRQCVRLGGGNHHGLEANRTGPRFSDTPFYSSFYRVRSLLAFFHM